MKKIFTASLLHLFAVNAVNRSELFMSIFLKKLSYAGSILRPPACLQLLIPLPQLSLTSMILLVNSNQIHQTLENKCDEFL